MTRSATQEVLSWGMGMTGLAYSEVFPLDRDSTVTLHVSDDEAAVHLVEDEVTQIHHAGRHELRIGHRREAIVFVSLADLPIVGFGVGHPTRFVDVVRGPLELVVEGAARLRVGDPKAFHEAFLRNTTNLDPEAFAEILETLTHASVAHALRESFDSVDEIEPDLRRLSAYLERRLQTLLAPAGLTADACELIRLESPPPEAPRVRERQAPPLATSARDR